MRLQQRSHQRLGESGQTCSRRTASPHPGRCVVSAQSLLPLRQRAEARRTEGPTLASVATAHGCFGGTTVSMPSCLSQPMESMRSGTLSGPSPLSTPAADERYPPVLQQLRAMSPRVQSPEAMQKGNQSRSWVVRSATPLQHSSERGDPRATNLQEPIVDSSTFREFSRCSARACEDQGMRHWKLPGGGTWRQLELRLNTCRRQLAVTEGVRVIANNELRTPLLESPRSVDTMAIPSISVGSSVVHRCPDGFTSPDRVGGPHSLAPMSTSSHSPPVCFFRQAPTTDDGFNANQSRACHLVTEPFDVVRVHRWEDPTSPVPRSPHLLVGNCLNSPSRSGGLRSPSTFARIDRIDSSSECLSSTTGPAASPTSDAWNFLNLSPLILAETPTTAGVARGNEPTRGDDRTPSGCSRRVVSDSGLVLSSMGPSPLTASSGASAWDAGRPASSPSSLPSFNRWSSLATTSASTSGITGAAANEGGVVIGRERSIEIGSLGDDAAGCSPTPTMPHLCTAASRRNSMVAELCSIFERRFSECSARDAKPRQKQQLLQQQQLEQLQQLQPRPPPESQPHPQPKQDTIVKELPNQTSCGLGLRDEVMHRLHLEELRTNRLTERLLKRLRDLAGPGHEPLSSSESSSSLASLGTAEMGSDSATSPVKQLLLNYQIGQIRAHRKVTKALQLILDLDDHCALRRFGGAADEECEKHSGLQGNIENAFDHAQHSDLAEGEFGASFSLSFKIDNDSSANSDSLPLHASCQEIALCPRGADCSLPMTARTVCSSRRASTIAQPEEEAEHHQSSPLDVSRSRRSSSSDQATDDFPAAASIWGQKSEDERIVIALGRACVREEIVDCPEPAHEPQPHASPRDFVHSRISAKVSAGDIPIGDNSCVGSLEAPSMPPATILAVPTPLRRFVRAPNELDRNDFHLVDGITSNRANTNTTHEESCPPAVSTSLHTTSSSASLERHELLSSHDGSPKHGVHNEVGQLDDPGSFVDASGVGFTLIEAGCESEKVASMDSACFPRTPVGQHHQERFALSQREAAQNLSDADEEGVYIPGPCEEGLQRRFTILHQFEQAELNKEVGLIVPEGLPEDRMVQFTHEGMRYDVAVPAGYEVGEQFSVMLPVKMPPPLERNRHHAHAHGHGDFQIFQNLWCVVTHPPQSKHVDYGFHSDEVQYRLQVYKQLRGRSMAPLLPYTAEEIADEVSEQIA